MFFGRGHLHSPSTFAAFSERVSLIIPLLFSLLAFSFRFHFLTEEHILSLAYALNEAYVLMSGLFFLLWLLAVGFWLLVVCC